MKKQLLAALALGAALCASAADYTVYQNGVVAEGLGSYDWWNSAFNYGATNPDGDGKVLEFKAANGGAAASFGIHAAADNGFVGKLANSTLHFDYYATTAGQTYTIRLTSGVEENYSFTTNDANIGKWISVDLPMATTYPGVNTNWAAYNKSGDAYVFSLILDGGIAESALYVNNIKYVGIDETWAAPAPVVLPEPTTVPVPAVDAANVISVFGSAYPAACTFGIGGWGQSTQNKEMEVDGKKVMKLTFFNYIGWELNPRLNLTDCNKMHVDYFAATDGKFGFTPISPGKEKAWIASEVKVGEWNSYDVPLEFWDNVDYADVFQIKFDQGNGDQTGYIANVYFYNDGSGPAYDYGHIWYGTANATCKKGDKTYDITADYKFTAEEDGLAMEFAFEGEDDLGAGHQVHVVFPGVGDQWVNLAKNGEVWRGKSTLEFKLGKTLELEIYLPYAGGVWHPFVRDYIFGAANEPIVKAPSLKLTAAAENITSNSADIVYTVKASSHFEGVPVTVTLDGDAITASPYALTGLDAATAYSYTLVASAELDGETYTSAPVAVEFKTLKDGQTACIYHAIVDGIMKKAYLIGEDATMRREIPVSIETTVTYNVDQTITVDAVFHGDATKVVGFVPKLTCSTGDIKSEYVVMAAGADGKYTMTTAVTYPQDLHIGWLFYQLAYAGADCVINVNGYNTGMENDALTYGDVAALTFSLSKTNYKVGETGIVAAIAKDAAGHYLLDGTAAELSLDGAAFTLEGNTLTAAACGAATVTATAGTITESKEIKCVAPAEAYALHTHENASVTSSHPDGKHTLAFDGNEGTQVEFNCAETQEHWILVDLGASKTVHAINLVWEGASAKEYTVEVSWANPFAPEAPADSRTNIAQNEQVFTITNGDGGAGVTPRTTLHADDFAPMGGQYVLLKTSKAWNAGWGIKLKEMEILGTDEMQTGIDNVAAAAIASDDSVEYYNLQGVRVANPEAGLYIRRQGDSVTKVVIR